MTQTQKSLLTLLGLGLLAAYFAYKPSTASVAKEIVVDADGTVHYGDHSARGSFGDPGQELSGIVQINERQETSQFPMLTNDFVLTSGAYADPKRVRWKARAGRRYEAKGEGVGKDGSFTFVTIIPASVSAAEKLSKIALGDDVTLRGRLSTDGHLSNQDGVQIALPTKDWKLILLDDVEVYAPPAP